MSTPKIGLEVHTQLNTATKLFCSCATQGKEEPNSRTCLVCLGHPGSKPVLNFVALQQGIKIALAFGCKINHIMQFSRKTYYYPDLAKNYQITQYETPLGVGGSIILDSGKKINLTRVHIEEDPAALEHHETYSLADYNRSGIPLVEIVTEPEIESPAEAREFLNKLMTVLSYLGVYTEAGGTIKADANISLKERNYTRVEIKNITGFKEIERALNYEIKRQEQQEVVKETRGWNAETGLTTSLRSKESEEDYGYIVDPDLPTITILDSELEAIRSSLPELSPAKIERYTAQLGLDPIDARVIANDLGVSTVFEQMLKTIPAVLAAKWIRRDLLRVLAKTEKTVSEINLDYLRELLVMIHRKEITDHVGQQLMMTLVEQNESPQKLVVQKSLGKIKNEISIKGFCEDAAKENPDAVADYKKGKQEALDFLMGQVMRKTKGAAAPEVVRDLMKELLR
ncbi:MAG: Asp-tRNA(Asn)/Glu-tRNA(Gln) amidotransferase subunit GatB [Candidatus Woesearchaeota archaeon]|nr:Asp-tRNA(Asn)/Glu-tRNA(Gln) amidotransferase subunit GatB [Candidatus Woesearchaeota archaeon]